MVSYFGRFFNYVLTPVSTCRSPLWIGLDRDKTEWGNMGII